MEHENGECCQAADTSCRVCVGMFSTSQLYMQVSVGIAVGSVLVDCKGCHDMQPRCQSDTCDAEGKSRRAMPAIWGLLRSGFWLERIVQLICGTPDFIFFVILQNHSFCCIPAYTHTRPITGHRPHKPTQQAEESPECLKTDQQDKEDRFMHCFMSVTTSRPLSDHALTEVQDSQRRQREQQLMVVSSEVAGVAGQAHLSCVRS